MSVRAGFQHVICNLKNILVISACVKSHVERWDFLVLTTYHMDVCEQKVYTNVDLLLLQQTVFR